jgi:hemerythrin superfamily protein
MANASRKTVARKSASTPARRSSPKSSSPDALALLRADHKAVSALFEQYEKSRAASKKKALAHEICKALTIHAQIEEEIFYPAVKAALKDKELVPEALVEHASMKALVAQIESQEPGSEVFDARVKVLAEYVKHHVKEEQNEMFPKVRNTRIDTDELGERLAARKQELQQATPTPQAKQPEPVAAAEAAGLEA